ncbi:MAG: L-threonylcarbamoyladenylate synthase [Pseudomonadota bacterium]
MTVKHSNSNAADSLAPLQTLMVPAEPQDVAAAAAAKVLCEGGLAALPTETVYGLAAAAESPAAVAAVYRAKGRPAQNPLIVHVASIDQAWHVTRLTPLAKTLAQAFWPGPLTLVLPQRDDRVAPAARAGGNTVAVRCPDAPLMRRLCADVGPLVAPSANRSGRISATSAAAVMDELNGRIGIVVDGGPSPLGIESTVVDCTGGAARILRPGAIDANALTAMCGLLETPPGEAADRLRSPGLLASHYAPGAAVLLNVAPADAPAGSAYLGFGAAHRSTAPSINLSPAGDLSEAASALYAALRALDAGAGGHIAVAPIPAESIGAAINDRLRRAAAPRPTPELSAP